MDVAEADDPDRSGSIKELRRPLGSENLRFQVVAVDQHRRLETGEAVHPRCVKAASGDQTELRLPGDDISDELGLARGIGGVQAIHDCDIEPSRRERPGRSCEGLVVVA